MTADGRGRVYLPGWLRRHPRFLIGTHHHDDDVAVMVVSAATGEDRPITVAAWIDEAAPTFGPSASYNGSKAKRCKENADSL
jgi:hypothetical protein